MNYDIENAYETEVKLDIYYDCNVTIQNDIEEESRLVEYTHKHLHEIPFNVHKAGAFSRRNLTPNDIDSILLKDKLSLGTVNDTEYYKNASPLSVSESNSSDEVFQGIAGSPVNFPQVDLTDLDEDNQSETEKKDIANGGQKNGFKKLSYEEVEKSLNRYYDIDSKYSNELDILISYLNGQKNLYLRAQHITQRNLNYLQLPSILFSSSITIFNPFIHHYQWSFVLITILNALIAFLISVIQFLKLESLAETYSQVANQYEKLSSSLEIASNKLLFMDNEIDQNNVALEKIKEFETELNNIKESYDIIIPVEVKQLYPIISYINIFSIIKKMEVYKTHLIIKFKDIKNEIRYILFKWNQESSDRSKEKARLEYLYEERDKIKEELIQTKTAYNYIDELFSREIKQAETKQSSWFCFEPTKPDITHCNPVIDKYMRFIFMD